MYETHNRVPQIILIKQLLTISCGNKYLINALFVREYFVCPNTILDDLYNVLKYVFYKFPLFIY